DQPRNQVPSQCPGRSRDEDSHDLSFRVMLSLEDKAPPEAVTLVNPAFRTARARPAPAGLPRLGRKNDLHAAALATAPIDSPGGLFQNRSEDQLRHYMWAGYVDPAQHLVRRFLRFAILQQPAGKHMKDRFVRQRFVGRQV